MATYHPATGQIWLGYAGSVQGNLRLALVTPSGVNSRLTITPGGDGIMRLGLRFAVHPVSGNVLAIWTECPPSSGCTVKGRLFNQNGGALTADITLSDPATHNMSLALVAASPDNFFVAGFANLHVWGRVLKPTGAIASDWTRLDFLQDSFGNPTTVGAQFDLAANPDRGTYAVVVSSALQRSYFIEVAASAGVPLTVAVDGSGAGLVTSDPPGISCPGACSMSVAPGSVVELFAAPAAFSDFTGWGGACGGASSCVVTVNAPSSVTATFTRQRFAVGVTTFGDGTVTSAPAGIDCRPTCSADFDGDSDVELIATAAPGWRFDGWSGACGGPGACVMHVIAPASVTATFVRQFTLSVTTSGSGTGRVTSDPAGVDCPGPSCSITVDTGTTVQLMAAAYATSRFDRWGGACSGSGACSVLVSSDRAVDAAFVQQFDVHVNVVGSGRVDSSPAGMACPGDCDERLDTGTDVVLAATAAPGWRFAGWSGDPACSGTGACTLSAADYRLASVTATFVEQFVLDVSLAGNGAGAVSGPEISCGGDCSATYDDGTVVTLTASAEASSEFGGWSGACAGTGACMVTMTAARSITATFTLRRYTLGVTMAGAGAGAVTASGIACPGDCAETFDHGTVVTLTAAADATSIFAGWSGACGGMGACTVTMTSAQSVTATFEPRPTYTLTVALAGDGTGVVTSDPAGINCGAACAAEFDAGSTVRLTAAGGATSNFVGWSGACSGTGACVVTMTAAWSVTATFDAVTIASVSGEIAALAPAVGAGPAGSLASKLAAAQGAVNRGNRTSAANQLNAAINEIRALVRSGRLDARAGAALIAHLQAIVGGL